MDLSTERAISLLHEWIEETGPREMAFLGGAGVSVESGIPDFRSASGLFAKKYPYPAEVMLSASFFWEHPQDFFSFYFSNLFILNAEPNQAHRKLAELEREGKLSAVITQNIDGLHQKAGSERVLELHGSIHRNHCVSDGTRFNAAEMLGAHEASPDGVPRCHCGGVIRPDVVLYEEPLDQTVLRQAVDAIEAADLLLVAGTSLNVYPAAGLLDYFTGRRLVIVNMSPTPQDRHADLCISAPIGEVMSF